MEIIKIGLDMHYTTTTYICMLDMKYVFIVYNESIQRFLSEKESQAESLPESSESPKPDF